MTDTEQIINLAEAKLYLKVNHKKRDAEINSLIDDVTADILEFLDRDLFTATYSEYFDIGDNQNIVNLGEYPIQSVAGVCDYGTLLTESTNYEIDMNFGKIERMDGYDFTKGPNKVVVTYVAGYDENDIPHGIKSPAKQLLYDIFYDRNAGSVQSYSAGQSRGTSRFALSNGFAPNVAARLLRWQKPAVR